MSVQDFIFVSIPKCGTNFQGGVLEEISGLNWAITRQDNIAKEIADAKSLNRFLFRHRISKSHIDYLLEHNYKFIFLYRDPRDQLISFIFWMMKMVPEHQLSKISPFKEQIRNAILASSHSYEVFTKETDSNEIAHSYWYHIYYHQLDNIPEESRFRVKFEDIVGEKGGSLMKHKLRQFQQYVIF